jgi:hypothetical protein
MDNHDPLNPFGNAPLELCFCPKCVDSDMVLGMVVTPSPEEIQFQKSWCSKVYCEHSVDMNGLFVVYVQPHDNDWIHTKSCHRTHTCTIEQPTR